jgi:hypothetical protein
MLKIRAQQVALLNQQDIARQKRKIANLIKKYHSDHSNLLSSSALKNRIDVAFVHAAEYGIVRFSGLLLFSTLAVLAGENFHRNPKFSAYFSDPLINGEQKMILLQSLLDHVSTSK